MSTETDVVINGFRHKAGCWLAQNPDKIDMAMGLGCTCPMDYPIAPGHTRSSALMLKPAAAMVRVPRPAIASRDTFEVYQAAPPIKFFLVAACLGLLSSVFIGGTIYSGIAGSLISCIVGMISTAVLIFTTIAAVFLYRDQYKDYKETTRRAKQGHLGAIQVRRDV